LKYYELKVFESKYRLVGVKSKSLSIKKATNVLHTHTHVNNLVILWGLYYIVCY
jgi:hypothetical protein